MHRRVFHGVIASLLAIGAEGVALGAEVPIVYSRCPRGHQPFPLTGAVVKNGVTTMKTIMVPNGEALESLPEVARPTDNFVAPCDLVYRDEQGSERILFECIKGSTKESSCAALDAAVSFDAKTIAFSVFRGPLERLRGTANALVFDPAAENKDSFYVDLPGSHIHPVESQIVLVDVATGKQTLLPFPSGTQNFGPTWLSNGRLAFSSSGRREVYAPMPLCNKPIARWSRTTSPRPWSGSEWRSSASFRYAIGTPTGSR